MVIFMYEVSCFGKRGLHCPHCLQVNIIYQIEFFFFCCSPQVLLLTRLCRYIILGVIPSSVLDLCGTSACHYVNYVSRTDTMIAISRSAFCLCCRQWKISAIRYEF